MLSKENTKEKSIYNYNFLKRRVLYYVYVKENDMYNYNYNYN